MYKDLKFPILIVHRAIKADSVAGERVRGIAEELAQDGFAILAAADQAEARLVAATHHGLACMLIAAEGVGEDAHLLQSMAELIRLARQRAPDLPIFALGEQVTLEYAPAEAMSELNQLRGILYLFEDTVPFLARQVARAAHNYLDGLLPPFFKALVQHTAQSNYSRTRLVMAVAWPTARARWGRRSISSSGKHLALGPVGLGARARLTARPHRPFGRGRSPSCA